MLATAGIMPLSLEAVVPGLSHLGGRALWGLIALVRPLCIPRAAPWEQLNHLHCPAHQPYLVQLGA